ncbi:hypothetical protein HETIRDRAFT_414574 [Heterobasidion irregulare TC 32-1]|uniref:F-box domain-containing protein n=1 Tax=Heterobasidion irregulare (strain TC 32-1) TaxID=747525 RepID=W4KI75_HETIT|nr:uncharacterized protein HETIRDRAFT_414574 [Heterobasidion irregulare TC 32-1]ETW85563.1 hypothetical protein HETIRDRAFT_414574 [Heterobasidion irregulare TC 32-1]
MQSDFARQRAVITASSQDGRLAPLFHQNALAPILKLPLDLLTTIFLFFPAKKFTDESPTWLRITHVCRRWREAAIGCALMWTNIMFDPPPWTTIMLARSRGAPLVIEADVDDSLSGRTRSERVDLALAHSHHARVIRLRTPPSAANGLIFTLKNCPSPLLEVLELRITYRGPCYIPEDIFVGEAPHLRSLTLEGCSISWRSHLFSKNLTYLTIVDTPLQARPSLHDLLSMLRCLSKLQILTLHRSIPMIPETINALPPLISEHRLLEFPHMEALSLDGFVIDTSNLIRYFVIPPAASVLISCRHNPAHANLRISLPVVTAVVEEQCNYRGIGITNPSWVVDLLQGSSSDVEVLLSKWDQTSYKHRFALRFCWRAQALPLIPITLVVQTLIDPLHLETVRGLKMAGVFSMEHRDWQIMFASLQKLETFHVSHDLTYTFADEWENMLPRVNDMGLSTRNAADTLVPLHTLKTLVISHAHFSHPLGEKQLFRKLQSALTRRRELGLDLSLLDIRQSHITEEQLHAISVAAGTKTHCSGYPETYGVGEPDEWSDEDG